MKAFRRVLSLVLTLVMLLSLYVGGLEMTSSAAETLSLKTGDLVTFGSYPQNEVKDSVTLSALNKKSLSWKSYGYYSGDGDWRSGSMKASDYMKYADVTYNGGKYRAVKFTSYRPEYTFFTCSADNSGQDENGYVTDKVYWFKYEPIVWRVLDSGKGLLMTEKLIDSQAFENDYYYNNGYCYGDKNYEHYALDWAYSSLREWLNGDFYKTAFASSAEKGCVRTTSLTTSSGWGSEYDAGPTKDKVFLLTLDDVMNSGYGFSSDYYSGEDTNRVAFGTDYAKCQGLWIEDSTGYYYSGASDWRLRTPYDSDITGYVSSGGYVYYYYGTSKTGYGVRAALNINLQSAISQSLIKKVKDSGNGEEEPGEISVSQVHTVNHFRSDNDRYEKKYFGGAAAALDGSGSLPDIVIPGLSKEDNMVPQGIAYDPKNDRLLISAYYYYGKKENVKNVPSRIFALDMSTGEFTAQFDLYKDDGKVCGMYTGHVGGIAASGNNLYISNGKGVSYFPLDDLSIPDGKCKKLVIGKENTVSFKPLNAVDASYLSVSGGVLYTGNFYKQNSDEYGTKWSEANPSAVIGFKLSGANSQDEWTALKKSAAKSNADITYKLPDSVSMIQGAAVNGGMLYLTSSHGRSNESGLYVFDVSSGKLNKKMTFSRKCVSMLEDLEVINGQLYTLSESGAYEYHEKHLFNRSITPADVVWRIDPDKLLGIGPSADIPENRDVENKTETFEIKGVSGKMNVNFRPDWFSRDSGIYEHELGIFCSQFATLGYDDTKQNLRRALADVGMSGDRIVINGNAGEDHVNYFIADRKINTGGEEYTLVFMGLIGSYYKQWYSNFTPGDGNIHQGFLNAKTFAKKQLDKYIAENLPDVDKQHMKILITGHSRGAAASNLLAADLIASGKYCPKESVFAYCFATPNSNMDKDETGKEDYKRIFNIVNPEDFVTKCLPFYWGYRRYGTTYVLPSKTNTDPAQYKEFLASMRSAYGNLKKGKNYDPYDDGEESVYSLLMTVWNNVSDVVEFQEKPFRNGKYGECTLQEFFKKTLCAHLVGDETGKKRLIDTALDSKSDDILKTVARFFIREQNGFLANNFEESHCAETYCAYMQTLLEWEMMYRQGYYATLNCPVDVEIYLAATGELVGKITDNEVDEDTAAKDNAVVMTVNGDEKSFWLPDDSDYEVMLKGNDDGAMDYRFSTVSEYAGELERVCFEDVALEDGCVYSFAAHSDMSLGETELVDAAGAVTEPDFYLTADDDRSCEVTVTALEDGSATEPMTAIIGDYVTLAAMPDDEHVFDGWYDDDDTLLFADVEYRFEVLEDVSITAKFKPDTERHVWDEGVVTDVPTCITPGAKTYTCADCGKTKTEYLSVEPDNHFEEPELVNAKEATETEDGYTGDKVCPACGAVVEAGAVIPKITQGYAPGDVNGDGDVLANDARLALRASAKLEELTDEQTLAADVNGDGQVLANDARQILRYSAKLQNEFEKG